MRTIQNKMQHGTERVATMYQPYVSRTIVVLSIVLAVSIFLYSAFLLEAVAHAASKTVAEAQVRSIGVHLSTLESQYLALTQAITPQKAAALGFVQPAVVLSTYATSQAGSLSFQSR